MLIVFSGLPGTGKTTIAQALASRLQAVYLRIDTIEQAIRNAAVLAQDVGASGYLVANEVALSNLRLGHTVIVDCVNPVSASRNAWRDTATSADAALLEIEVICSDTEEHRRRVETRTTDIPGLRPPAWASVLAHDYEPWNPRPFYIDTAQLSPNEAVTHIIDRLHSPEIKKAPPGRA